MKNGPYILVIAPDTWPGKRYRGRYCYEHQLIYWQETGVIPGPGELIHHIDGDKTNNIFGNLILQTILEHNRYHSPETPMTYLTCAYCGNPFSRETRIIKSKLKEGQKNFFCCKSHQVKQQWLDRKSMPSTIIGNGNAC